MIRSRRELLQPALTGSWAVVLSAVLLWPLTRSGYLLGHDMVFTPQQPLNLASIGISSASPRAVPLDGLVAITEKVVNGAVVGRLALILPLIAAGTGAAALLRSASLPGRLAACTASVWNPFVVERLALGQWALVWAYAALPWLLLAITRGRGGAGWLGRGAALAAASITPTGGLIASVCAVTMAGAQRHRSRRDVLWTAALALAMQLPWIVPAVVSTATATSDPAGVTAFAARADGVGGAFLALVSGGGGIWDGDVVPGSRGGALLVVWLVVVVVAAVFGARTLGALATGELLKPLAVLALAGLLLAMLPGLPGGATVVRAAVAHVPGAGILRDAQKWVMPLVLLEALLVGAVVERATQRWRGPQARALLGVAAVTLPVIALPDAAATLRPVLTPVHYPADWNAVARRLGDGDVAVLPWGSYRTFPWVSPERSVLDPAPRLLPAPTVVDDTLTVSGRQIEGEDPRAREVGRALTSGEPLQTRLARLGIRWVVVEQRTPGGVPSLTGLHRIYGGPDVALYEVRGPWAPVHVSAGRVVAVIGADLLALLALMVLVARAVAARSNNGSKDPGASADAQL